MLHLPARDAIEYHNGGTKNKAPLTQSDYAEPEYVCVPAASYFQRSRDAGEPWLMYERIRCCNSDFRPDLDNPSFSRHDCSSFTLNVATLDCRVSVIGLAPRPTGFPLLLLDLGRCSGPALRMTASLLVHSACSTASALVNSKQQRPAQQSTVNQHSKTPQACQTSCLLRAA